MCGSTTILDMKQNMPHSDEVMRNKATSRTKQSKVVSNDHTKSVKTFCCVCDQIVTFLLHILILSMDYLFFSAFLEKLVNNIKLLRSVPES